jgi:hypothetical protein
MESIYWVMAWACHRKCRHCYEDRFRPYVRAELESVVREAERNTALVLANLPARMTYLDPADPRPDGAPREKQGRIILSGGESLLLAVRDRVTFPVIEGLAARYRDAGGVKIVLQTTGDLLTPDIVREVASRGVWMISVAGVDDFHVGMEGEAKQAAFKAKLIAMMRAEGLREASVPSTHPDWLAQEGPIFSFFGATPDSWIGKLWPRGRAWENGLSTATIADNFCNRWSGGLNFLRHGQAGSEVSIEPDGSVYPCCLKTKLPLGNLTEERLIDILDSLKGDPVYEAINAGAPERMGIGAGWSVETFLEKSRTVDPKGRPYANLCIGCDRFHEEVLGARIQAARARRLGLGGARLRCRIQVAVPFSPWRSARPLPRPLPRARRRRTTRCWRRRGRPSCGRRAASRCSSTPGAATTAPTPSSPGLPGGCARCTAWTSAMCVCATPPKPWRAWWRRRRRAGPAAAASTWSGSTARTSWP